MSKIYPVELRVGKDSHPLKPALLIIIEELISFLLLPHKWDKEPNVFLFRALRSYTTPLFPPFGLNVLPFFSCRMGVQRGLTQDEIELCRIVQKIYDSCDSKTELANVFGRLFERVVFETKRKKLSNQGDIILNASICINGQIVSHYQGSETTDIGTDQLDSDNYLELCECSLTMRNFEKKGTQLGFYTDVLEEIRSVVGKTTKLKLQLICADSLGYNSKNLMIPTLPKLKRNSINVTMLEFLTNKENVIA